MYLRSAEQCKQQDVQPVLILTLCLSVLHTKAKGLHLHPYETHKDVNQLLYIIYIILSPSGFHRQTQVLLENAANTQYLTSFYLSVEQQRHRHRNKKYGLLLTSCLAEVTYQVMTRFVPSTVLYHS